MSTNSHTLTHTHTNPNQQKVSQQVNPRLDPPMAKGVPLMHTCEDGWAQLGPSTASPESEGKPAELKRFGAKSLISPGLSDDLKHDLTSCTVAKDTSRF